MFKINIQQIPIECRTGLLIEDTNIKKSSIEELNGLDLIYKWYKHSFVHSDNITYTFLASVCINKLNYNLEDIAQLMRREGEIHLIFYVTIIHPSHYKEFLDNSESITGYEMDLYERETNQLNISLVATEIEIIEEIIKRDFPSDLLEPYIQRALNTYFEDRIESLKADKESLDNLLIQ